MILLQTASNSAAGLFNAKTISSQGHAGRTKVFGVAPRPVLIRQWSISLLNLEFRIKAVRFSIQSPVQSNPKVGTLEASSMRRYNN